VARHVALIQATQGSVVSQRLGDLANYRDEAVQKRLRAVVRDPDQFFDVLVEVSCAAWHISRGHKVEATQRDGMPDLELEIPGWQIPIQAECKRVKRDSRIKGAIEKANRQIKNVGQRCYGLVYHDISEGAKVPELVDLLSLRNNKIPDEIAAFKNEVQRLLGRVYTSVSGVILLWKRHTVLPMKDGGLLLSGIGAQRSHFPKTASKSEWGTATRCGLYRVLDASTSLHAICSGVDVAY